MQAIVDYRIDENIFSDKNEYFFTFLFDRFEYITKMWVQALEKRFKKKFRPIWILSSKQNEHFEKGNFVIINKKLKHLINKLSNNKVIHIQDYEDLNKEFSESKFIEELIEKLAKKQSRIFILGFTSSCLNVKNNNIVILGPDPKIVTKFDKKTEHIKLFEKLRVPRNKTRIYKNLEEVKKREKYPFFISASYTSGGHESKAIYTEEDLDIFYSKLREINKKSFLVVADLIKDVLLSPNVNAIIYGKNKTEIICITDQILRSNQYLGNTYPSKADKKHFEIMTKTTKIIGNHLSKLGFRGLFGLDFIIDSRGRIYTVDLNPRRQGGYLCNVLMSKKINIIELELSLVLEEKLPDFTTEDFQADYCWGHSKIKPYYSNMKIKESYKEGDYTMPFLHIGSFYKCIFYPENHILIDGSGGYFILSGRSSDEIKPRLIKQVEICISNGFELYEGVDNVE